MRAPVGIGTLLNGDPQARRLQSDVDRQFRDSAHEKKPRKNLRTAHRTWFGERLPRERHALIARTYGRATDFTGFPLNAAPDGVSSALARYVLTFNTLFGLVSSAK